MQTPPKNLSVAPSIGISKNYNRELMSLCSRRVRLECQIHMRQYSIKHRNMPNHNITQHHFKTSTGTHVCLIQNMGSAFVEDFTLPDLASRL